MQAAFGSKNRRPKFQLTLRIIDLNNVPLVSGSSFIKWDLPHSTAAEHRGRTNKCNIRDHSVVYDYEKSVAVRLSVDKNNNLEESTLHLEVLQEYSSGARGERIVLGNIKLNLAEYTEPSEVEGDDGIVRRYLMQDSKINSTLKIGIYMKLLEAERNFVSPTLRSAPVFGGIAGIIAGEQGDAEDVGHMPSLTTKSREAGEAQDIYRRNLAAQFNAQPGELRADECIENIFSGGDGWGPGGREAEKEEPPAKRDWSRARDKHHERNVSLDVLTPGKGEDRPSSRGSPRKLFTSGQRPTYEVDEFEVREHLRSWVLPDEKAR